MFISVLSLVLASAFGFTITDHQAIHDRIVHDLAVCGLLPANWTAADSDVIRAANVDEDIDFVRKMDYSHYYNPFHTIKMERFDSSVTIIETQKEIEITPASREQILQWAGRITHHLQDSAVPMHVIPVAHDPTDKFENFKTPDWDLLDPTPVYCNRLREPVGANLVDLLTESAKTTYASMQETYEFSLSGAKSRTTWLGSFWLEGTGQEFGQYGFLGNTFGVIKSMVGPASVEVEMPTFTNYKSQRMVQAKWYSEKALLWVLDRLR